MFSDEFSDLEKYIEDMAKEEKDMVKSFPMVSCQNLDSDNG